MNEQECLNIGVKLDAKSQYEDCEYCDYFEDGKLKFEFNFEQPYARQLLKKEAEK